MDWVLPIAGLALLTASAAGAPVPDFSVKPASRATVAAQERVASSLPADDGEGGLFASQGFIATLADPVIRAADGRIVRRLDDYDWMGGKPPATVNPSLWLHMLVLRRHGLFKVAEGVWQVRGFDAANLTVVSGLAGWIVIDPLTTQETAAAALALVNRQLGARPVTAVIYTHSHADHFGGVRGVVDPARTTPIFAPADFLLEAVSENAVAGNAMMRRADYQFGNVLTPGPQGAMDSGIGATIKAGTITLLPPTEIITKTGEIRIIDGVMFEFQMVPDTEAPAELNLFLPTQHTLLIAETATCTLHNIQAPRGAPARNALKWAASLTEAIELYGPRSDVLASSHCWPRFGREGIRRFLGFQRDNYKFLHDQSVRRMNNGETADEIAEDIVPPRVLTDLWANRNYYGTFSHNAKAVYHRYLGWYEGVPSELNPHPPTEAGRRLCRAGGWSQQDDRQRSSGNGGR